MNLDKIRETIKSDKDFWKKDQVAFENSIEKAILEALQGKVILDADDRPCVWISAPSKYNDEDFDFRIHQVGGISVITNKGCKYFLRIN